MILHPHPASQSENKENANCIATASRDESREIPIQLAMAIHSEAEFLTLVHIEFGMYRRSVLQRNFPVPQRSPYWQLASSRVRCCCCAMRGRDKTEYMILLPLGNKQSMLPPCCSERQSRLI